MKNMKKPLIIGACLAVLISLITLSIVFYFTPDKKHKEIESSNVSEKILSEKILIDKAPAYKGARFFEESPVIQGQQAYVSYPLEIEVNNPPILVIYSHGSNTRITKDFDDPFMKDMRDYGSFFTEHGYIFAASNEHGEDSGSDKAVDDILNLIDWISKTYPVSPKVNLIGFSRGGLAVLKFSFKYPEKVKKVVLLASVTQVENWGEDEVAAIRDIGVKIYHGGKDVNVSMAFSTEFVDLCKKYGKTVELEVLPDAGHFDIDTELKDKILVFLKNDSVKH